MPRTKKDGIIRFRNLRQLISYCGMDGSELAQELGKSQNYVSDRFMGKQPWNLRDIYKILELCDITWEEAEAYFPPDGVDTIDIMRSRNRRTGEVVLIKKEKVS